MPNYMVLSTEGMKRVSQGGRAYLNTLVLRLFSNNFTPLYSSTLAAFTECNFHGYAAQNTVAWSAAATNSSPPDADMTDANHGFTATDSAVPNTVYGAYFTDPTDPTGWVMAMATNISPPAVLDAAGKSYVFTPRLTAAPYAAYP